MENEHSNRRQESVFSHRVRAGKRRTYFFDVRKTKGDDFYITLTESTKRFNGEGYERHKIFLYKEDFNRFAEGLQETIDHVKTELMPDYDYDEYTRRNQEWEEKRALEASESAEQSPDDSGSTDAGSQDEVVEESGDDQKSVETEDDMEW